MVSNGQDGTHDDYKVKAPGVVTGRSGTLGEIFFVKENFWPLNTTLWVKDFHKNDCNFIYYFLKTLSLSRYNAGSGVPTLNRNHIISLPVCIPPLSQQKTIAEVLSSLDDKIDLLHRQNKTLEDMAQTLFRQWFVEEADEGWDIGKLGDAIDVFDNKRIPLSKIEREKKKEGILYPYYGAAKIMDYVNDYIFEGEYILMAEDGTVKSDEGYPVLQYATGKFWTNNHTHVLKAKKPYQNFFIWHFLLKLNIENCITGAVQPKINQENLNSIEFPKYPIELIIKFGSKVKSTFRKMLSNQSQIYTLENLRDTLLPKLMSGEMRVKS